LIHHSDHGNQYLSIHYTERLAEADIKRVKKAVEQEIREALKELGR